jgi:hypothetical protein
MTSSPFAIIVAVIVAVIATKHIHITYQNNQEKLIYHNIKTIKDSNQHTRQEWGKTVACFEVSNCWYVPRGNLSDVTIYVHHVILK